MNKEEGVEHSRREISLKRDLGRTALGILALISGTYSPSGAYARDLGYSADLTCLNGKDFEVAVQVRDYPLRVGDFMIAIQKSETGETGIYGGVKNYSGEIALVGRTMSEKDRIELVVGNLDKDGQIKVKEGVETININCAD